MEHRSDGFVVVALLCTQDNRRHACRRGNCEDTGVCACRGDAPEHAHDYLFQGTVTLFAAPDIITDEAINGINRIYCLYR
jgi:hypothetical protein